MKTVDNDCDEVSDREWRRKKREKRFKERKRDRKRSDIDLFGEETNEDTDDYEYENEE